MRKMSLKHLWLVKSAQERCRRSTGMSPVAFMCWGQGAPMAFIVMCPPPLSENKLNLLCWSWCENLSWLPRLKLGHSHALKWICKPRRSITVQTDNLKGCIFRTCEFINIYTFAWSLLAAVCLCWLGRGWGWADPRAASEEIAPVPHLLLVSLACGCFSVFYGQSRCLRQVDVFKVMPMAMLSLRQGGG